MRGELLMKYIICEDFGGHPVAFLFPERVDHMDMRDLLPYAHVISAGYIALEDGTFRCFGGNKELNTEATSADTKIILNQFGQTAKPK